jgi:hypothetical protein
MSFQAYLDKIEEQTGLTPRQLIEEAHARGLDKTTKAGEIADWLKQEHGLGHGHAMALVHVIKNGPQISSRHVGSAGSHRDQSDTLWLDGKASKPAP